MEYEKISLLILNSPGSTRVLDWILIKWFNTFQMFLLSELSCNKFNYYFICIKVVRLILKDLYLTRSHS